MPDSPLCPICMAKEIRSHTYKVAGRFSFKCQTCANVLSGSLFKESDFNWRSKGSVKGEGKPDAQPLICKIQNEDRNNTVPK